MATPRLIDSLPEKTRIKDVDVLVLGFSRTGKSITLRCYLRTDSYKNLL
jgi:hypothetical protein